MSVTPRKLKDGKTVYDARVFMGYDSDGKADRRQVTCRTKRAAELEEAKMLAEKDAMRNRSGRITLSRYIDAHYWPVASKRLAATSLDTYEKEIRLRIKPHLGNLDVRDINRRRVQAMVDAIETEAVARKCVSTLKTILNHAKGDGLIAVNPCEAVFAMPQKGCKRDNGLVLTSFEQIAELLAIVRQNGSQSVQRIAYTGLLQGLRPEERYALMWSDFGDGTISVSKAYAPTSAKHGGERLKGTKTEKSTRVLPMHPWFAEWFAGLPSGGGAFIQGADGGMISPSTAQKRWRRFLRDNPEAAPVTIENMRHSFATAYLHAGGSVEVLSKLLGHSNISTTVNRYFRPDLGVLKDDLFSTL